MKQNIDSLECAKILEKETHSYIPKKREIKAIKYDGTLKMAIAIEEFCKYSWVEYDEAENFCGLRAFTENGKNHSKTDYVGDGDYLIKTDDGWYMLIPEHEFEDKYERN